MRDKDRVRESEKREIDKQREIDTAIIRERNKP